MEATEYARSKGWSFKERGKELILTECPLCHDCKNHFYLNSDTSEWFCHKCQEKGNLWDLMKRMGDAQDTIHRAFKRDEFKKPDPKVVAHWHQMLLKDEQAMGYLKSRGIAAVSVVRFQLGLSTDQNGGRWLTIPHIVRGEVLNIKSRSLPPADKTFRRETGCRSVLFNADAIAKHQEIIITEGEIDAITLLQAGFQNAVGATNGAGAFDADWVKQLESARKIYICFDNDEAGQKGAVSLAKRLGYNRCLNVLLPDNDINDYMRSHSGEDFKSFLQDAKKFQLPGVIGVNDALDLLQKDVSTPKSEGLTTPWDNVNRILGSWNAGDLIIVTALPKTGKTTWCLDVTRNLILSGKPCLFYCLEMRPERLIRKMIQAQYRIDNPTILDIQRARTLFQNIPLYFGYQYDKNAEIVINLIRDAIQRYDLRFVVFDNIHMLCRTDKVNEELSRALLSFKHLAEQMEIPILLIAQPRKREGASNEILSAEDVKHTSAFHSDCDQMIILHRKRTVSKAKEIKAETFTGKTESLDPLTVVRVEAHRYGPGGETLLYYKGEHSRFDQVDMTPRVVGKERSYR